MWAFMVLAFSFWAMSLCLMKQWLNEALTTIGLQWGQAALKDETVARALDYDTLIAGGASAPPVGQGIGQGWAARLGYQGAVRSGIGLAGRFLAARIMSVVTLIAVALFFKIEVFATFGVYLAAANIAWVALFLRYETAIPAAQTPFEAEQAVRLSAATGGFVWFVLSFISVAAGIAGLAPLALALLFPLSLLSRAVLRLCVMIATRSGDFQALGRVALVQALIQPPVLLALAASAQDGALSLALADVIGHGAAAFYLVRRQKNALAESVWRAGLEAWSRTHLSYTARLWSHLPMTNLPGSLLALAFVSLPVLIMPLMGDAVLAGYVALAFRLFDIPTQIIAAAATPVMINKLRAELGGLNPVFGRKMMINLAAPIAVIFAAMTLGLMMIDPWLEGTAFAHLVIVAPWIALFQASAALSTPLAEACGLFKEQRGLALIHAGGLVSGLLLLALKGVVDPLILLIMLAFIALGRALLIGERLRYLSLQRRDDRVFQTTPPLH
jgi:hypothetical protein